MNQTNRLNTLNQSYSNQGQTGAWQGVTGHNSYPTSNVSTESTSPCRLYIEPSSNPQNNAHSNIAHTNLLSLNPSPTVDQNRQHYSSLSITSTSTSSLSLSPSPTGRPRPVSHIGSSIHHSKVSLNIPEKQKLKQSQALVDQDQEDSKQPERLKKRTHSPSFASASITNGYPVTVSNYQRPTTLSPKPANQATSATASTNQHSTERPQLSVGQQRRNYDARQNQLPQKPSPTTTITPNHNMTGSCQSIMDQTYIQHRNQSVTTPTPPMTNQTTTSASTGSQRGSAVFTTTTAHSSLQQLAWKTRYCCFGCSVKEATLVIAIVFIVIRILHLVCACIAYVQLPQFELESSAKTTWLPAFLVANIVDSVFEIVGCILLIKATKDDNRYLLIPWLVYNSICILYSVIGAIHFLFVSLYVGLAGIVGGVLVIFLSIRIYFFLIVAVYYKLILEGIIYAFQSYAGDTIELANPSAANVANVTIPVALPMSNAPDSDENLFVDGSSSGSQLSSLFDALLRFSDLNCFWDRIEPTGRPFKGRPF